jgi:hypothetical protein
MPSIIAPWTTSRDLHEQVQSMLERGSILGAGIAGNDM